MYVFIQFFANESDDVSSWNDFRIIFFNSSILIGEIFDTALLILFHTNSIGLRSGEYGGRCIRIILSSFAFSLTIMA